MKSSLPLLCLALLACNAADNATDTADVRPMGEDATITVFDDAHVYFGDENLRQIDVTVTFPDDAATYSKLQGKFRLSCPNDRCDHWDRYGTFGYVLNAGTDDEQYVELERFITAYRTGFKWRSDLTDMRPVLSGEVTLRVFIDTWVGPGHTDGEGWLFDADILFEGGEAPIPEAVEVLPVWGHQSFKYGADDNPVPGQVVPTDMPIVAGSQYMLRSFISGHGFGGNENCAEFCPKDHTYTVADTDFTRNVWRDDCDQTETDSTQLGTWEYSRAGWCPGDQVAPWDSDVTDAVQGKSTATFGYDVEDYSWNGSEGEPYFYMSGVLVRYE